MNNRVLTFPLLLLLAALLLVACGGSTPTVEEQPAPTEAPAVEEAEPTELPAVEEEAEPEEEVEPEEETEPEEEEAMTEGEAYKIGVVIAETGGASSLGIPEAHTARMVAEQLDAAGGVVGPDGVKHPVEVIIYDSETNPDNAASAINRLISEDDVDVVLAGSTSGNSLAMVPIATENKIPMISMASSGAIVQNPETGEAREWIFKTPLVNSHAAKWHMEYFTAQGMTDVCYLYENTGYGQDVLKEATIAAEAAGINIIYSDAFERSDTEFPQMASLQTANCEAVVVASLVPGGVNARAAVLDFVGEIPILHGGSICNNGFLSLEPTITEGAIATCPKLLVNINELPDSDPQKAILTQYSAEYEAFTGEPADSFGGHAYDGLEWAIAGLESLEDGLSLEERRAGIRDAMENDVENLALTGGIFSPSPDDHLGSTYATSATLVRVVDGQFTFYSQEEWGGELDLSTEEGQGEAESGKEEAMTEGEAYKIGVVIAETGGASSLGIPEAHTARMVAEQLDAAGGVVGPDGVKHPVEVIIYDSETNPDNAASAINRLISEDDVDVVLAGSTSGNSLAMVPIATENKIAMISMASSGAIVQNPETGEAREWIFKTPLVNSHAAKWHMEYFTAQGMTDVCYLYENTGYGQDVLKEATIAAEAAGINIIYSDAFERSDTEFPQMASLQTANCEAVVVASLVPGGVNARAAVLDFVGEIPILHGGSICNNGFLSLEPTITEGAIATCPKLLVNINELPDSDPQKAILEQYSAEYEAFTGEPADSFGGHAYDGFQWAIAGLESLEDGLSLEERRAGIRDAMENEVENLALTGGIFSPSPDDHLGSTFSTSATLVRVVDGQFEFYPEEEWAQ